MFRVTSLLARFGSLANCTVLLVLPWECNNYIMNNWSVFFYCCRKVVLYNYCCLWWRLCSELSVQCLYKPVAENKTLCKWMPFYKCGWKLTNAHTHTPQKPFTSLECVEELSQNWKGENNVFSDVLMACCLSFRRIVSYCVQMAMLLITGAKIK